MRYLGGLAVISLLIVATVVLNGSLHETSSALKPIELPTTATMPASTGQQTPTQPQQVGASVDVNTLLTEARTEWITGPLSAVALARKLHADEPGIKVSTRPVAGGIVLALHGSVVALCDQAGVWTCTTSNLASGGVPEHASAGTLASAEAKAFGALHA